MKTKEKSDLEILIEEIRKPMEELQAQFIFPDEFKTTIKRLVKSIEVFKQNQFEIKIDFEAFNVIGEIINDYTQNVSSHTLLVSRHGWFIDLIAPIDLPVNAYNLFKTGKIKEGNKIIGDYYCTKWQQAPITPTMTRRRRNVPNKKRLACKISY